MRAFLPSLLLLALLALAWSRDRRPPDRCAPWAPLDLRAMPDMSVRYRLERLGQEPRACKAALARAGARFDPVTDRNGPDPCGWVDAAIVTCPLAATLVLLDRQVLQPAARQLYRRAVTRIDHVGSYACRNLYGRSSAPPSRHARAAAIDLTGFVLADGRELRIAGGWQAPGKAGDRACEVAGMVLGPDYNREQCSHFHLERAVGAIAGKHRHGRARQIR
ncbi:extensin family protein [Frateuria soli]|uniref:extensin-like domain-containing protein n=1 Tax=Frateuria soli TaxID=1542730 RepID=UPI001E5F7B7D|nr:extensin family protein [Frateuria soli]UGB38427.1 extensin family protein [Frateuria soli]